MKKSFLVVFCSLVFVLFCSCFFSFDNELPRSLKTTYTDLHYTALGDSITKGEQPYIYTSMANPWPKLVSEELGFKSHTNMGIGGSTISNHSNGYKPMVDRYSQIPMESDIISIMGGINDLGRRVPLGAVDDTSTLTLCGAYNYLLKNVKSRYPDAYVFVILPIYMIPNNPIYDEQDYSVLEMNARIKAICEKHDVDYLSLEDNAIIQDLKRSDSDGVHPWASCVKEVIAPQISDFIKENYTF